MDSVARLVVTRGPDEGRQFDVSNELAHIGRDGSNQIVLSDPALAKHQASIVCRGGRFALFTPITGSVQVDGADVPAERWVWLPSAAEISLGLETMVRFEATLVADESLRTTAEIEGSTTDSVKAAPKDGSSSTARRRRKRTEPKRTAAKLQLDAIGEPRVQLGADGRLPELNLSEATSAAPQEADGVAVRPWLAIIAVVASTAVSALLLLWSPDPAGSSSRIHQDAREQLKQFYGKDADNLEPYQKLLRQAAVERSQGRLGEERRMYLRVLDLLNSSDVRDPRNFHGLTGRETGRGRNSDAELRQWIETLIASPAS